MSLKARIEAVIYAAEEPVTLAQLAALFGAEALAARAERLGHEQTALAGPDAAAGPDQQTSGPPAPKVEFSEGEVSPETAPSDVPEATTAESAADAHAGSPASGEAIMQAVENPEQVAADQADGFALEQDAEPEAGDEASSVGQPGPVTAAEAAPALAPADDERRPSRQREREVREEIRRTLDELIAEYDQGDRGIEIREIAGGYRVATRPEYHDAVRGFIKSLKPPMKLSLQALETLAVIAYKQPVTAPEVSEIRGVDSGGVMGSLISRKLVTTAGRKQVIGRPILYKTTKEFLLRFGLKDLAELPSMEEFEKMAGELAEPETATSAQLDLPPAASRSEPGDTPMPSIVQEETSPFEATLTAAAVEAAPGIAEEPAEINEIAGSQELEEAEEEELRVNARANVQVDDETAPDRDLPGVTRDTAGRVDIDRRVHSRSVYAEDEY
jgi:segregation and condensation protein B